ncbi:MAG TPA: hypothetical protein VG712_07620 [Gemmatimonadales bacterium]|nr:hypothetical protein [Gemmatimonadales bacterium]
MARRSSGLVTVELEATDRIHGTGIESGIVDIPDEAQRLQHDVAVTLGYVLTL